MVADRLVAPQRLESKVMEVKDFQPVGVTWPKGPDVGALGAEVRTRNGGTWSSWVGPKPADDAPDAGTSHGGILHCRGDRPYRGVLQRRGRGWCDIGHNFIGVHARGFNTGAVGVAMLGTFGALPSAATQDSVGWMITWRLGASYVDPQGAMTY